MLFHNGTCNTITTLDSTLHAMSPTDRSAAVGLLIHPRIHADLLANVKYDIARQQGTEPAEATLAGLVADRDWLFTGDAYHLDTSHLSAAVRLAKAVTDPADLALAVDLTDYGRRLDHSLEFQAEPPFAEFYPSHGLFLREFSGEGVDEAVAYFRKRAEEINADEEAQAPSSSISPSWIASAGIPRRLTRPFDSPQNPPPRWASLRASWTSPSDPGTRPIDGHLPRSRRSHRLRSRPPPPDH